MQATVARITGIISVGILTLGSPAAAQETDAERLFDLLAFSEVVEIMREEGVKQAETLSEDFFPGRGGADWNATVEKIYNLGAMNAVLEATFTASLEGADTAPMVEFFESDVGTTAIQLELSARRAMLDPEIEAIAEENAALAAADETPRYLLIQDFIEANFVIESNVVGALNSNYAFFIGLLETGAFGNDVTEEQVIADVWGSEDNIRQSTREWADSFFVLAYQPLSDEELSSYIEFSGTGPGLALNRALFAAYDDMLQQISTRLGKATGRYMSQQEL